MNRTIVLPSGKTIIQHDLELYWRKQRRRDMEEALQRCLLTDDELLETLSRREREIYVAHSRGATFVQIGRDLHLTPHRARQVHKEALRRLNAYGTDSRAASVLTIMLQSIRNDASLDNSQPTG